MRRVCSQQLVFRRRQQSLQIKCEEYVIGEFEISTKQTAVKTRINEEIRAKEVRVIDENGDQAGILSLAEALQRARAVELDLVEVSPTAQPPVCKIMNYGKHVYQQKKNAAESKKKLHKVEIKEVKFRPVTDDGDYQVKLRNLIRFLEDGDKTKVTVRFRGRELAHRELGLEMLKRISEDLAEYGVVEQFPKMEGKQMAMLLAPKKK
jgi:translation initiation factor IF-3